MITVIIPVFNMQDCVAAAIRSALSQTLAPDEILVIDDGSTDATASVARAVVGNSPVRVVSLSGNHGVYTARNAGLAEARGKWVAFLDADDTWDPPFLERMSAELEKDEQASAVFCWTREISLPDGKHRGIHSRRAGRYDAADLLEGICPPGNGSSLLIRKSAFDEAGLFMSDLSVGADSEMWVRMARRSSRPYFLCLPEIFVTRYRRPDSLSILFDSQRAASWTYRLDAHIEILTPHRRIRVLIAYLRGARSRGPQAKPWIEEWSKRLREMAGMRLLFLSPTWFLLSAFPARWLLFPRFLARQKAIVSARTFRFVLARLNPLRAARRAAVVSLLRSSAVPDTSPSEAKFFQLMTEFPPRRGESQERNAAHARASARAADIIRSADMTWSSRRTLEIGCGDGLLSYHLWRRGHSPTLCDVKDWRDDASRTFPFLNADVTEGLPLDNDFFDFIFSYNAFEHHDDPGKALKEMVRLCRPGGKIYISMNPIYASPWGLHAYKTIPVPYTQFLFSEAFWKREHVARYRDFDGYSSVVGGHKPVPVNMWRVAPLLDLFRTSGCRILNVRKTYNETYLPIVRRFPSAFQGRGLTLDDLTLSGIAVLLEKP